MSASRSAVSIPQVVVAAEEVLRVVIPPAKMEKEEMNAVLACLVSTLHTKPGGYLAAVELVYNIIQLALPGVRGQVGDIKALQVKTITLTKEELLHWVELEEATGATKTGELPVIKGRVVAEAKAVTSTPAVYSAVASLVFAMGRQASESAATSALDKRPDALIRRFDIAEEDRLLLPGRDAGPSRDSLELLYNAFSVYTELRGEVVRYLIGVTRSASHLPLSLEIIMTNFMLMRGAGMTHVDAIMKLAKMHPWTLKVPQLEPYWEKFASDLVLFQKVEQDVRPYHRLLVNQSSYLFLSPGLAPLVAVAGHFIEEVESTFSNYVYKKSEYTDLLDLVDRYAPGYIPTHKVDTLASLLGVSDVELPTPKGAASKTNTGSAVV